MTRLRPQDVIRVFVTDRDAEPSVALESVILKDTVTVTPRHRNSPSVADCRSPCSPRTTARV